MDRIDQNRILVSFMLLLISMLVSCAPLEPRKKPKTMAFSEENATVEEKPKAEFDISVAEASANKALAEKYNFAAVCQPLFKQAGSDAETSAGVLTNDGSEPSTQEVSEEQVNCWEGPSVSTVKTHSALSGSLDADKAKCLSSGSFWDTRGGGSCFEVDEMELNCQYSKLKESLDDIFGINGFLTGYQELGWRVEQCGLIAGEPYLNLSTVVVKDDEVHYISKIAFLRGLAEICEGKSGGACEQLADNPEAQVLFVSSPNDVYFVNITELGLEKE